MSPAIVHVSLAERIVHAFREKFGRAPRLFRAPGRVNLIGEHTDYNDGFVMPVAISRFTYAAVAPRADRKLTLASLDFEGSITADLDQLQPVGNWADYVLGVAAALEAEGSRLSGADLLVSTEVPIGAGLSSSAALETVAGLAMSSLAGNDRPDRVRLALAGQKAEHTFVGMMCGIMDQFISALGQTGHALLIDCRSLEWERVHIPEGCVLGICNTGVKHELASSEYNQRRQECEEGVRILRTQLPSVTSLRDVSLTEFERHAHLLPDAVLRRCRHVISENQRVLDAREAMRHNDFTRLWELLAESHISLRDDFEVSCPELDTMVEISASAPGFIAGRMTGGGFGGCTVNLVETSQAERFARYMVEHYKQHYAWPAEVYLAQSADGAQELPR